MQSLMTYPELVETVQRLNIEVTKLKNNKRMAKTRSNHTYGYYERNTIATECKILKHLLKVKTAYCTQMAKQMKIRREIICKYIKMLHEEGYIDKKQETRKGGKLRRKIVWYSLTTKGINVINEIIKMEEGDLNA